MKVFIAIKLKFFVLVEFHFWQEIWVLIIFDKYQEQIYNYSRLGQCVYNFNKKKLTLSIVHINLSHIIGKPVVMLKIC